MTKQILAATAREDAYRLLAACYYSPTQALKEENCCGALASILAGIVPEAADHARKAAAVLQEATVEELLVEYARLFLGPFKLVAPPYGSVWLDDQKTVMGESTRKVAAFYHASGLSLADDFQELPDHIAVELEFNSYLAFKQRESASAGEHEAVTRLEALQREFLETFLQPWLSPFTEAVINDGEAPFYVAIARCTAAFVAADARQLANASAP